MIIEVVVTVALTLLIAAVLFCVFRWVKTPYYRVDAARMIHVLELVLTGQATDNDWQMTFSMTIRHYPDLEAIRQQCVAIEEQHYTGDSKPPYLFSKTGLTELTDIIERLKKEYPSS